MQEKINELKQKLTGDMFTDMEIKEEIHKLEMAQNDVKPGGEYFTCVGCGS